ncbi:hypothetical protein MOV08_15380 [Streptomyces yunnanensis]|uniref:Uncharacterized protein n=1 Tax=Streptomyces yunnanensis TaxID=156453 RepID=A0ABY8A6F9_9ACTN|nr:hypothetical protein [Streptomyces yunnanensis]WEB40525.1 hypothetical protein MOV08_15380 [Streptomyces yunnanensis]
MISFIETHKMTDPSVVAPCALGISLLGTGLSGLGRLSGTKVARPAALASLTASERIARPTEAPAAAVATAAHAFAFATAANGAESREQYQPQNDMWAYRGLEPWRDPA